MVRAGVYWRVLFSPVQKKKAAVENYSSPYTQILYTEDFLLQSEEAD
ncbi:MAG: hypothetical protein AAFV90_15005 [Cyanobacteria bacterium J06634_5]